VHGHHAAQSCIGSSAFLSLTVLFTIGHIDSLGLEHGCPLFKHRHSYSTLLLEFTWSLSSRVWTSLLPFSSLGIYHRVSSQVSPCSHAVHPLSFATTRGLSFDSSPQVLRCFNSLRSHAHTHTCTAMSRNTAMPHRGALPPVDISVGQVSSSGISATGRSVAALRHVSSNQAPTRPSQAKPCQDCQAYRSV